MFKFFLRWVDSWSLTDTLDKQQPQFEESTKDTNIQWFRILPFILLHIACFAVFWVGVSWFAVIFMLIFYFVRMFAITAFLSTAEARAAMEAALAAPSLWDAAIAAAARAGLAIPAEVLERDVTQAYGPHPAVEAAFLGVYRDTARYWELYQLAEKLVDIDDAMATWRHKHVVTVERVIGGKRGTGGTAGAAYLHSTLGKRAFPELWSLRTSL